MATEKIGFDITVNGVERTITSFKDLKKATKDLRDEQLAMSAKFGDTSEQAKKAGQKLAELKDKVEDLNDSTKSLKGTGIERLTASFRLLSEGIATFDFDKIKLGFKGVGAAMSAIPIFLIIEGLKLLYDNFEKVVDFFNVFYASTDTATRSLKKLNAAIEENSTLQNEMLEATDKNTKFAMLSAQQQGKSELELQEIQRSGFEKRSKYASEYLKTTGENYDKILANELSTAEDRKNATKALNEARKSLDNELTSTEIFNLEKKIEANTKAEEKDKALKDKANEALKAAAEKRNQDAKAAAQKKLEDEKKLLADIEKAKEESYIKTFKTEVAQAIAKAQFENDKLIASINSTTASQATKNKALAQAEITLQENYAQIQKDYKVKQDAIEKEAEVKRQADADKAIAIIETNEKKKIALQLSNIESSYQLEAQRLANQGKNLQEGSQAEEENNAKKVELQKKHLKEIYDINIANADLLGLDVTNIENKYLQDKEAAEDAARERKKAKEKKLQKDIVDSVNIAAQTTLAVSKTLSDTYYMKETQKINKLYADKLKNVKQGSKEEKAILDQKAKDEKDLARQQFETQKKFNRASAIMNGILGLGAIFAVPDPTLGIMSAIRAIALVATTAANVAQINSTQFDEGGSSAGGIPAAETSAPTTSQAPSIYGPGQGGQSTTFTGNQNNSFAPVKAYVVETENRSTTNRVNKLVSESTYG